MQRKIKSKRKIKPFDLSDFVKYQKDSIISREIVNKPTGTVTLFSFDKGQGLSEHKASFDALVFIIEGEASVAISGKLYKLKENEMIIMPANRPHSLRAIKRFKMLLTMIRS